MPSQDVIDRLWMIGGILALILGMSGIAVWVGFRRKP